MICISSGRLNLYLHTKRTLVLTSCFKSVNQGRESESLVPGHSTVEKERQSTYLHRVLRHFGQLPFK